MLSPDSFSLQTRIRVWPGKSDTAARRTRASEPPRRTFHPSLRVNEIPYQSWRRQTAHRPSLLSRAQVHSCSRPRPYLVASTGRRRTMAVLPQLRRYEGPILRGERRPRPCAAARWRSRSRSTSRCPRDARRVGKGRIDSGAWPASSSY